MLANSFKTRKDLCLWLQENKPLLEDETGIKFSRLELSNNLLVGTSKDFPDCKVLIKADFKFNRESLKSVEAALEDQPEEGKYIGVAILAEKFPENLGEYYKTLRKYVRLVLFLYLNVDGNNRPVFDYPEIFNFEENQ